MTLPRHTNCDWQRTSMVLAFVCGLFIPCEQALAYDPHCADPPPAPSSIAASEGTYCDQIRVSWADQASCFKYFIVWRNDTNDPGTSSESWIRYSSPFYDTPPAGRTYYYWVQAVNYCSLVSEYSECANGYLCGDPPGDCTPGTCDVPSPPGLIYASQAFWCQYVQVEWTSSYLATRYEVWRSLLNDSNTATYLDTYTESDQCHDYSAQPGTTYYYWVKACNDCGCSGFSPSASGSRGTPGAPIDVNASNGTGPDVQVSWATGGGIVDYYTIWRNTTSSSSTATQVGSETGTPYIDGNAEPGTTYYYWVKAHRNSCTSSFSSYDTGWRSLPAPPTGVNASDGDTSHAGWVRVTWPSVGGATHYRVYRNDVNNPATSTPLGSWWRSELWYNDHAVEPLVVYYYWVRSATSWDGDNPSDWGVADSGYDALAAPENLWARDGEYSDRIVTTWSVCPNASYYRLFRSTSANPDTAAPASAWQQNTYHYDWTPTIQAGVTYYYWVKAASGSAGQDASAFSDLDSGYAALAGELLVVTHVGDSGAGSLRQAIIEANSHAGPDTITFDIGSGPVTIQPDTPLPSLTDTGTTIDGRSQPGYAGTPLITIDGAASGNDTGLTVSAENCAIRGVVVTGFAQDWENGIVCWADNCTVADNHILGNYWGLYILSSSARIADNVVSDNYRGIVLAGSYCVVDHNLIGLSPDGTQDWGNSSIGIWINLDSHDNIIGTSVAERNVISGNGTGIHFDSESYDNTVSFNYIGTDVTGTAPIGNSTGVWLNGTNNTVGVRNGGNVISGNLYGGIVVEGSNRLIGNWIGTNTDGDNIGNGLFGIAIYQGAHDTQIGAAPAEVDPVDGNIIHFNGGCGIELDTGAGTGNALVCNSVNSNGDIGIDFNGDGVTANDTGDPDAGANNLQNYPTLTSARLEDGLFRIEGTLDSLAEHTAYPVTVQFFNNAGSSAREGVVYLGMTLLAGGPGGFEAEFAGAGVEVGDWITATATDSSGNTSEFSEPRQACVEVTIVQQPQSQIACVGDNVSFSVVASGNPTPGYQWRKDGVEIAGAMTNTLVLGAVTLDDEGNYDVVVTNTCSSATSGIAPLAVQHDGAILQNPADCTACEGEAASFAVLVSSSTPPPTYQWRRNESDLPGETSTVLVIDPVTLADDGSLYDVVITHPCGTQVASAALLTVNPLATCDCQPNGVPDSIDIATGTSDDCNNNGNPDECDIQGSTSLDENENGIPDECEIAAWAGLDGSDAGTGISGLGPDGPAVGQIAVGMTSDGRPIVGWEEDHGCEDERIVWHEWDGLGWGAAVTAVTKDTCSHPNPIPPNDPHIATTSAGDVLTCFGYRDQPNEAAYIHVYPSQEELLVPGSEVSGWGTLEEGLKLIQNVRAAVAPDDTVYVAYKRQEWTADVNVLQLDLASPTPVWTSLPGAGLAPAYYTGSFPLEIVVYQDQPVIAFDGSNYYDQDGHIRGWNGSAWEELLTIDSYPDWAAPDLTVDGDDDLWVTWYDDSGHIHARRYVSPGNWVHAAGMADDVVHTRQLGNCWWHSPMIDVDAFGSPVIVWGEYDCPGGPRTIQCARLEGDVWVEVSPGSSTPPGIINPQHPAGWDIALASGPFGLFVAWTTGVDGQAEVFGKMLCATGSELTNRSPIERAAGVPLEGNALSWFAASDASIFEVRVALRLEELDSNPVINAWVLGGSGAYSFSLEGIEPLLPDQRYFWRVDSMAAGCGGGPVTVPGAPYSFTTQVDPDCNRNGVPDSTDLLSGTSEDCNGNGVPDECDVVRGSLFATCRIASPGYGGIYEFDWASGQFRGQITTDFGGYYIAFSPWGTVWVGVDGSPDSIEEYDAGTWTWLRTFTAGDPLINPRHLAVGPDGNLFVSVGQGNRVLEYDGRTGELVRSLEASDPYGLAFSADGNLLIAARYNGTYDRVVRYDLTRGTVSSFVEGIINNVSGMTVGPNGNLFVISQTAESVLEYDLDTGDFVGAFVTDEELGSPTSLVFGPDGDLYVADNYEGQILRYDGVTGQPLGPFTSGGWCFGFWGLAFCPSIGAEDCTGDGIPDACEPDCQPNGVADSCDIDAGTSLDCQPNGIPDECEQEGHDCNSNQIPDECESELEPVVVTPPDDLITCEGQTAEFAVEVDGWLPLDYQWRKDDEPLADGGHISGAGTPTLTLSSVGPADIGNYDVVVSNTCGTATSYAAILMVTDVAPTIWSQPDDQIVYEHQSAVFIVGANGTGTIHYQWYKNGSPVGADNKTYSLLDALLSDDGAQITCEVSDDCGSATSAPASLTVLPAPTGACCLWARGCLEDLTQDFCEVTLSGVYAGDGTSCDEGVCGLGACCMPDGSCEELIESQCLATGGSLWLASTACTPDPCPHEGACCAVDGTCSVETEVECTASGGTYLDDGVPCDPNPCPLLGACCMPDGNCHYLSEAHCLAAGGLSWDQGTACEPNPCPRWGACCVAGDCVPDQTKEDCLSMGGQWAGLDTVCDEDLCVKGVCCVSDICVPGQTVGDCSSVGGEWAGLFTTCFTGICPVCDDGDQDRDGDIDLVDFAELQTCFGCVDCGGDECKCLDINNDNTVTLDDFASFQQALTGP